MSQEMVATCLTPWWPSKRAWGCADGLGVALGIEREFAEQRAVLADEADVAAVAVPVVLR